MTGQVGEDERPLTLDELRTQAEVLAGGVVERALAGGATIAVAESLTGGLVAGTLASVPGVSAVLRGGVVAYATELKAELLGVDAELLATGGAVQAEVARQMAQGVAARLGATHAVATTGVAGPDPQDGQQPGTVYIAVLGRSRLKPVALTGQRRLPGDRALVRWATVCVALDVLHALLGWESSAAGQAEQHRSAPLGQEEERPPAG